DYGGVEEHVQGGDVRAVASERLLRVSGISEEAPKADPVHVVVADESVEIREDRIRLQMVPHHDQGVMRVVHGAFEVIRRGVVDVDAGMRAGEVEYVRDILHVQRAESGDREHYERYRCDRYG